MSQELLPSIWPLAGRTTELVMTQRALDDAAAGKCSALLFRGESGIGKTRLAHLAVRHAAELGWTVASGSAYPVETGIPYALFADALVPVLRHLGDATLTLISRGATSQLAQIFPALTLGQPPADAPVNTPELKGRLLWTVAQLLVTLSTRAPVLLVLENLQWADPSSLELLHFIVRQVRDARIAVVATYNDTEYDAQHLLQAMTRSLVELGAATRHEVTPLERDDIDELLQRVFGAGVVPKDAVTLLHARTRGNPFFLEETVKSLVATGRVKFSDGSWIGWGGDLDGLELPKSIRDALAVRVASLGATARAVADCAAVIGTRFGVDVLHTTTAIEIPVLLTALEELCRRNVLSGEMIGGRVVYDFTHPMVRDTLYGQLGIGRAALLHAQVAEALERLRGDKASEHVDELAFHFAHASLGELSPKAVRYLLLAGESALEKHADREAVRYLGMALDHANRHAAEPASDRASPTELADLVMHLALANQRIGHHDAAVALWERARTDALAAGDVVREAKVERRMGLACFWQGHLAEGLRHCENGLRAAIASGRSGLRAQLRLVIGACLMELGRPRDARASLLGALDDADEDGDAGLRARVHRALLLASVVTCAPEDAREHAARTIELAARAGQLDVVCTAHWALAVLAGLTGNVPELERQLHEAERIADELRSPSLRLMTSEVAIEYLAGLGDWTTALARAEQSIALARTVRNATILARLLIWTAVIYVGRGDLERAKRYLDEATATSGVGGKHGDHAPRDVNSALRVQMGWTMYYNALGEYDEAIRVSREGLALAERSGQAIWAIYRLWPALIEAHLWKREFDEAQRLSGELRQASALIDHRLGLAWADTGESLAQMLRGTTPALLERVVRAADALERVPFVFDAARVRREIARRYVELGDHARAVRVLEQACAAFDVLGALGELTGARAQLLELGVQSHASAPARTAAHDGDLTERQVAIARLVAARKSNKEIGHALGISYRTVSTHLYHIFKALNVDNRGKLADYVRDGGLLNGRPDDRSTPRKNGGRAATRPRRAKHPRR